MAIYDINGNNLIDIHFQFQWKNKIASFLGDSITQGTNTTKRYDQFLNELCEFSASNNYGISGSKITDGNTPMYSRANSIDINSDIVFVFGGTNDFIHDTLLGSWYTESGDTRTFNTDTSTFCGALNVLCENLITRFPKGQIVLMTPVHRGVFQQQPPEWKKNGIGIYFEEYVNKVKEAAEMHSVNLIDLYGESRLYPYNTANSQQYYHDDTDELHPSAKGHEAIARIIYQKMKSIPYLGDI